MILALMLSLGAAVAGPRGVVVDQPVPANLEEAYEARRVALVVGIDQYVDPALGDLRYAAKDAQDIASVLMDPAIGDFNVVYPLNGTVSRDGFWAAFDAVTSSLQRDDTFFLYVAGHGTLDLTPEGTQLYVMPSDAWLSEAAQQGISLVKIEEAIAGLPAQARVTLLDTCHSGTGRSGLAAGTAERIEGLRGPIPDPVAYEVSSFDVRLFSAHYHQPAIEDEKLQNGVYTHYFVQALEGQGDADGDGLVEVGEAFDWARDRTLEFTGGVQVPWVESTLVGRKKIYLAGNQHERKRAERAVIESLTGLPANTALWVDGVRRGPGPLLPGRHNIELATDETLLRAQLRVRPGQHLDLGAMVQSRRAQAALAAGLSWMHAPDWFPAMQGQLSARWLPRDVTGSRLMFGAQGGLTAASVADGTRVPAGQWGLGAGLLWGEKLRVGPQLSAGMLWKLKPDEQPYGALHFAPGAHLHLATERTFLSLEPSLNAIYVDRAERPEDLVQMGFVLAPQFTLSVGSRLMLGVQP